MKVYQEEKEFRNVTITIETNHELVYLISIMQSTNKAELSKGTRTFLNDLYPMLTKFTNYQ